VKRAVPCEHHLTLQPVVRPAVQRAVSCKHRSTTQVSEQPLSFGSLTVNGRRQVRYNARKLSELPYHLIESGMVAELRQHVLFNYDWLHSKLAATSLPDVLADFHVATTALADKVQRVQCIR